MEREILRAARQPDNAKHRFTQLARRGSSWITRRKVDSSGSLASSTQRRNALLIGV
jgi:hypothetical protein